MSVLNTITDTILETGDADGSIAIEKILKKQFEGEGLHQLTKPIRDYRNHMRGEIQKKYSTQLHQFSLVIDLLSDIQTSIGDHWKTLNDRDLTKYKINTTTKLYMKSVQSCIDLLALFENGGLTSTMVIWRTIYENYVTIDYLLQQEDKISLRFNDHAEIESHKILNNNNNKDKVDVLKIKHGVHFNKPYGWAYLDGEKEISSFSSIIKYTKEKDFFNHYKLSNKFAHASSFSLNKSLFSDGINENTKTLGMFTENWELPFELTIRVMKKTSDLLIDYFYYEDHQDKKKLKAILSLTQNYILKEFQS